MVGHMAMDRLKQPSVDPHPSPRRPEDPIERNGGREGGVERGRGREPPTRTPGEDTRLARAYKSLLEGLKA
jgi:hypothetical protein